MNNIAFMSNKMSINKMFQDKINLINEYNISQFEQKKNYQKQNKFENKQNLEDLWNIANELQNQQNLSNIQHSSKKYDNIQVKSLIYTKQKQFLDKSNEFKQEQEKINLNNLWEQIDCLYENQKVPIISNQILDETKYQNQQKGKQLSQLQKQMNNNIKKQDSKVNYGWTKLIPGVDFIIHNIKKYCLSPYKEKTYSYLGIKIYQNYSILYNIENGLPLLRCDEEILAINEKRQKQSNQQIISSLKYFKLSVVNQQEVPTEHIATIFLNKLTDGVEQLKIKLYDQFEAKYDNHCYGKILTSDGYKNDLCYCKTTVDFFPSSSNNYQLNQKINSSLRLQMLLNICQGCISINMGINGIKSSSKNCCLTKNHKQILCVVGILDDFEKNILVKISEGISPVISFVTAISRQQYINNFNNQF